MPNTMPFVGAAFICERVLEEKDGVLSAIRMVDTFWIPDVPKDGQNLGLELSAVVMLKSGDVTGKSELAIKIRTPAAKTIDVPEKWPIVLNGGEHGAVAHLRFTVPSSEAGLYWFDVYWNGELLTSFPLKVVLGAAPAVQRPPGTG
jgi:uncharacterized protein DUF6941